MINNDYINEKLENHDRRLVTLEINDREHKVMIEQVCKQMSDLCSQIRWLTGVLGTSLLGFFFYALQQGLFK